MTDGGRALVMAGSLNNVPRPYPASAGETMCL